MVSVIGCNLIQRMLSVKTPNKPLAKFLTSAQNIFCGQLGIDTTAIEESSSKPSYNQKESKKIESENPDYWKVTEDRVVDNPAWKVWDPQTQTDLGKGRQRKRRKRRTIKKGSRGKYHKKTSKRNRKRLKTRRRKHKRGKK